MDRSFSSRKPISCNYNGNDRVELLRACFFPFAYEVVWKVEFFVVPLMQ